RATPTRANMRFTIEGLQTNDRNTASVDVLLQRCSNQTSISKSGAVAPFPPCHRLLSRPGATLFRFGYPSASPAVYTTAGGRGRGRAAGARRCHGGGSQRRTPGERGAFIPPP